MNVCNLSEALQIIHSGDPFSLKWVTADKQRNRGGEIIEIQGARLSSLKNYKPVAKREQKGVDGMKISKDPHHWINGTRNILLSNGKIRKVHIQLILEINGKKVLN